MENRCVCCGEIIPEGRQVCPSCESGRFSEKERIEQFSTLMKPYVPEDFFYWLIEKGFFKAPRFYSSPRGIFRGVVRSFLCSYQNASFPDEKA